MHQLHRDPQVPGGLNKYRHGRDSWSGESPTADERLVIWEKRIAMQGERCAYCEAKIAVDDRHIEHFRQRSRYPQGTFQWSNLFGSCNRQGTCGDHKDKCGAYNHTHLIKPDEEDPDDFLVFDPSGGVSPKKGLSPPHLQRAEETIRILNLKNGGLPRMRFNAAYGYLQTVEEWAELESQFPEEEWRPIVEQELAQELANTAHLPFATAIRHTLARVSL